MPSIAQANKLFIPYCTSDAHMGDGAAFGMQFRGAAVVRAALAELVTLGLGQRQERARLLFGGMSAGARGAMVFLDDVPSLLPEPVRPLVQVLGFLDSAAWIDLPVVPTSWFAGFANVTRDVFRIAKPPHLGARCAEAYPGDGLWRCIFGQYRLPFITSPVFLVADQYDSYQLDHDLGHWHAPRGNAEFSYANHFANLTSALLSRLASSGGARFAYSARCHRHAISLGPQFSQRACMALSMERALEIFLERGGANASSPAAGAEAEPLAWIDASCEGFNCCCEEAGPDGPAIVAWLAASTALVCGAVAVRRGWRRRGLRLSTRGLQQRGLLRAEELAAWGVAPVATWRARLPRWLGVGVVRNSGAAHGPATAMVPAPGVERSAASIPAPAPAGRTAE
jgi:hypothetical protein